MTMKLQLPWAGGPDPEDALALGALDPNFRGAWAWEQPARLRARWRLTCDGAPVATLATHGAFGGPSTARFAGGAWEIAFRFRAGTVVTRAGEAEPWGSYRPGWLGGGRLARTGDAPLLWRRDGFWTRSWSFTTTDHLPLVRFHSKRTFLRQGAAVELEDAARHMPDLPALLALGWLLVLQAHRGHASRY
jgi:hypothetical protein